MEKQTGWKRESLNEWKEQQRIAYKVKASTWGDNSDVKMSSSDNCEQVGDSLIVSAFYEGIQLLDQKTQSNKEVSMRDYGKLMSWCVSELKKSFEKQLIKDKSEGWKITAYHWPGEDNSLFSTLNLPATDFDKSFKKKLDEGIIDNNGIPIDGIEFLEMRSEKHSTL